MICLEFQEHSFYLICISKGELSLYFSDSYFQELILFKKLSLIKQFANGTIKKRIS